MEKKTSAEEMKEFEINKDLNMFFENFIKEGNVIMEREVVSGFKVKLRPLSTSELLSAETVLLNNDTIPTDVVLKVRAASILSQSIISINGMDIEKKDSSQDENVMRRSALYKNLLSLPALIVQKSYELYLEAVNKQNDIYTNGEKISENIENF